jgi:hypothetical protein
MTNDNNVNWFYYKNMNVPLDFVCFEASAAPRPENSASAKDALFRLDTQITIFKLFRLLKKMHKFFESTDS